MHALAGFLSGVFHALTGADHLAALLPSIFGKNWFVASCFGIIWALGHCIASTLVTFVCFLAKDFVPSVQFLDSINFLGDFLIGATILAIGAIGLYEAIKYEGPKAAEEASDEVRLLPLQRRDTGLYLMSAVFVNGIVLGFSWDGLPSLTPALGASSFLEVSTFLVGYVFGTVVAMASSSALIGLITFHWSKSLASKATNGANDRSLMVALDDSDCQAILAREEEEIPEALAAVSSVVAIGVGTYWIAQTGLRLLLTMTGKVVTPYYLTGAAEKLSTVTLAALNRDDLELRLEKRSVLMSLLVFSLPFTMALLVAYAIARRWDLWSRCPLTGNLAANTFCFKTFARYLGQSQKKPILRIRELKSHSIYAV